MFCQAESGRALAAAPSAAAAEPSFAMGSVKAEGGEDDSGSAAIGVAEDAAEDAEEEEVEVDFPVEDGEDVD